MGENGIEKREFIRMGGEPVFYLMHKNIIVCRMVLPEDGKPRRIEFNDDATDYIPLGGRMNLTRFHEWWEDRAVPRTRQGAKKALRKCKPV